MLQIAEVMEIKKSFKPNQKDDKGNELPLGSIKCRMAGNLRLVGNIYHIWARPAHFNRRVPLVGEQVLIFMGPAHDATDGNVKAQEYFFTDPINATDDLVLHQLPNLWSRDKSGAGPGGSGGSQKPKPGESFPANPKAIDRIQPFEGDDIWESRFGSSIRQGSTVQGGSYAEKPTWQAGSNGDPILIIKVKKPAGGNGSKYSIEDIGKDETSLYMTVSQKLANVKVAFSKNKDCQKIPTFTKPQIILDSDRVVLNAKNDMVLINSKTKTVLAGKEIVFQSDKYNVNLDDLMEYLKEFLIQYNDNVSGKSQFATPSGPTATATNIAQVAKLLQVDFKKNFELL